jgi:hypothetical protein
MRYNVTDRVRVDETDYVTNRVRNDVRYDVTGRVKMI